MHSILSTSRSLYRLPDTCCFSKCLDCVWTKASPRLVPRYQCIYAAVKSRSSSTTYTPSIFADRSRSQPSVSPIGHKTETVHVCFLGTHRTYPFVHRSTQKSRGFAPATRELFLSDGTSIARRDSSSGAAPAIRTPSASHIAVSDQAHVVPRSRQAFRTLFPSPVPLLRRIPSWHTRVRSTANP